MKDIPGGTWITLEGKPKKIDIVMVGYKYNKSKALIFVMTRGSALTAKGEP